MISRKNRPILYCTQALRRSGQFWEDNSHRYKSHGSPKDETLTDVGVHRLYRINPDGSGRKHLTFGRLDVSSPTWSPDGGGVVFTGSLRRSPEDEAIHHLYIIDADGTHLRRLTYGRTEDTHPEWLPNGRFVLFRRTGKGKFPDTLCIVPASGGTPYTLISGLEDGFDDRASSGVSSDGRWVALQMGNNEESTQGPRLCLYSLTTPVHAPRVCHVYPNVRAFAWSPSGHRLYLNGSNGTAHILDLDSGKMQLVTHPIFDATWLDDTHLVGTTPPADQDQLNDTLRFIDSDGREQRHVSLRAGIALDPRYRSGDNSLFATMIEGDDFGNRVWHPVPGAPGWFLVAAEHFMSDGIHDFCYLVDTRSGIFRLLRPGKFFGFSPNEHQFLSAEYEWVGPYKRGGARVGALEVVSTFTGQKVCPLTGPLNRIEVAKWR